jgi:hypothetical protein
MSRVCQMTWHWPRKNAKNTKKAKQNFFYAIFAFFRGYSCLANGP